MQGSLMCSHDLNPTCPALSACLFAHRSYAFQNLAFSKIRYGAGVSDDGSKFRDPAVSMSHIYMANKHYAPGWNIVDLYVICMYVGFMDEVFDTWLKLTGIRKGGANLGHAAGDSAAAAAQL
jgi:hypothetical protein